MFCAYWDTNEQWRVLCSAVAELRLHNNACDGQSDAGRQHSPERLLAVCSLPRAPIAFARQHSWFFSRPVCKGSL